MSAIKYWAGRFRALFRSRQVHDEITEELRFHIEQRTQENIRRGMSPDQARREARLSFGHFTQIEEQGYGVRGGGWIESFLRDFRYGLRALHKSPGFTTVALLSLALGIGANTAIFQLLDAVRIRTLPVRDPQGLAEVKIGDNFGRRGSVYAYGQITNPLWEQIRDNQQSFSEIFAWGKRSYNLANGGEVRNAHAILVSGSFFDVLGVSPVLGRLFTPADDRRGCGSPGTIISYSFWQREFAGDSGVVGRKLSLESHPLEIIGVTPPGFFGLEVGQSFDVAVPICGEALLEGEESDLDNGTAWWLVVIGRLKPGWSMERATSQLGSISPGIFKASLPSNYPPESIQTYLTFKLGAFPAGMGSSQLRTLYSAPLVLLLVTAGLVLLIACANLANLMLARASAREREISVRLALGASRLRLLRQLMTESLLMALAGSLLGLGLARLLSGFLVSFLATNDDSTFVDLNFDWRVLGFTAGLAVLTCVLFGLAPAIRSARSDLGVMMKGIRAATSHRERSGLRKTLVIAQISLSLMLLVGALLFSRSLRNLLNLDPGFQQNGVLAASLDLSHLNLPKERRIAFRRELVDRLQSIPGVAAAASTDVIPMSGNSWSNNAWMESTNYSSAKEILFNRVSPAYFKTLQQPLLAGRTFSDQDIAAAPKVAMVNEEFARQIANGTNPVGKRFWRQRTPYEPETLYEIVGLVKNAKYRDLREDFPPTAFLAASQDPRPDLALRTVIRSSLPTADLVASVKNALAGVSPAISVDFDGLQPMIQRSLLRERLMATLSGFFGFLAALLAAIGLYGVISYMVARRTTEIGIRMALGADRTSVLTMILREALILIAVSLCIGTGLTLILTKAASSLLFGLKPHDPFTLTVALLLLAIIAIAASYLPARRATKVDPMVALRCE